MSGVEAGVDRIVDQIVNPKLNSTFLPEVETVIYNCFGTTKAENEEEDLLNGNDDHSKNGDSHDQSIGGKISTRNLSTISSDTEMLNVEKTSGGSSPGPGLAGQVSPLTPGASPSVATGAISPLTPAGTPPERTAPSTTPSGTPPPPPPGESDDEIKAVMETEPVEMEVDTEEPEEARPQSAYTPPLPQAKPRTPPLPQAKPWTPPPLAPPPVSFTQPMPVPEACPPQPPSPPACPDQESGGEASMSSISDTDLGDVSPPMPRQPPPVPTKQAEESSASASGTEDEDLAHLMKMKAELMAQLEGDFKLSPEEDSEDEEPAPAPPRPVMSGGENLSSDDNLLGVTPPPPGSITAPPLSSTSGSPSPPPAKKDVSSPPLNPPGAEGSPSSLEDSVKEKLLITEGCKPSPQATSHSPRSPGGGSQGPGSGPGTGSVQDSRESQSGSAEGTSGFRGANTGEQGQSAKETHKNNHSHRSSKSSHSSKSDSSRRHSSSSGSMSKEERRKMEKLKQQQKDKIKKYEEKVKSNDRLKSDKFQALDIFSSKKPSTPYQPLKHKKGTGSVSGESTPTGQKPQKKDFEKKLDDAIKKELERREEEKKKKAVYEHKNKVSSSKIGDSRRSSDHERSSQKYKSKDHSIHKDNREKYRNSSRDKKDSTSSSRRESTSSSRRESTDNKPNQVDRVKTEKFKPKRKDSEEKERMTGMEHRSVKESKPKAKDDINELLKKKISSLGVDNIQKMLMESLVEKTGASISEDEKQKMMTKMENMIKTESTEKPKAVVKSSPKKRARSSSCSTSSGSSTSSSSSDSEEEQIVRKSSKVKLSPKETSKPVNKRPIRQRKINTFSVQSDESDADSDFVKPVIGIEKLEPKSPAKTSPNRPKADFDHEIKSFSFFDPEDVKKASAKIEAYENHLADEDSVKISPVREKDINDTIPSSRIVSLDYFKESEELIQNLLQFGGSPRLYKPVPDWLIPYLEGAKVKLEDVEMPHKHEIVDYLRKKETGKKKRKAGWDIVVDWVPQEQTQVKRSKLEKQLGFDFDSSFGCSIGNTDGKRSRRSAAKFDTSVSSVEEAGDTSSDQINGSFETPSMVTENGSKPVFSVSEKQLSKRKSLQRSTTKADQEKEVVSEADTSIDQEPEADSQGNKENKESVANDPGEPNMMCDENETSPGKKRRSRDIIAAYLTSAGVERANKQSPENETALLIEPKSILEKLDVDINEANNELDSVIDNLRNKRKRPQQGELKVEVCV